MMFRAPKLVAAAICLVIAHFIAIVFLQGTKTGAVLSDTIYLAGVLLAAVASFLAFRRTRLIARTFWLLTSSTFVLWAIAQASNMYYEYLRKPQVHNPDLLSFLFFFAVTPLFLTLFLVPGDDKQKTFAERALDAVQVLIVALAAFIFFVYIPSKTRSEQEMAPFRLLFLHLRNLVLAGALTARAMFTRSRTVRQLFAPMAVVMATYAFGDWIANWAIEIAGLPVGTWFDLAFTVPFAMAIIAAALWRDPPIEKMAPYPSLMVPSSLIVYLLPLYLPLYLFINAGEAVRAKAVVASVAVAASFLCFIIRQAVTQAAQRSAVAALIKTEDQLRQAQKMEAIGTLAGGVAHDFNNLLTVITGYSELLLDSAPAAAPETAWLQGIQQSAMRGAGLTRQLLAFSRKQVLQPRVLDINHVLENLKSMLHRLIEQQVEIVTHFAPDVAKVKADPGQLEQVIMNLVINARDAMPQGGRLTLETSNVSLDQDYVHMRDTMAKPGDYVVVTVSDTGVGMDAATQARMFEPFYTTKEMGRGTGLGLSTVYGIVKQSGGWIWVYSEVGKGTTFKVFLPQVEGSVTAAVAAVESKRKTGTMLDGNETILLVEDDRELRLLGLKLLQMHNYIVLEASTSAEAAKISAEHAGEIALIISDVVIPGDSGPDLVKKLQQTRPRAKVLYVSGYTKEKALVPERFGPNSSFLEKPFTPIELATKVRELLDMP